MPDLSRKFCHKPFEHFETHPNGQASLCCPNWLPYYSPAIGEDYSVNECFNNEQVKEIRKSILDGSYKYCKQDMCPHIQEGLLPDKDSVEDEHLKSIIENNKIDGLTPRFYNLCHDKSCNLTCPSCRNKIFNFNSGPHYDKSLSIQTQIEKEVFGKPHNRYCLINVTGSGDPFGSKIFRDFLFRIDGKKYPKVLFNLQSNGVLFNEKTWDRMHKIHDNINTVIISLDAGTKETYNVVRKGGHWEKLQDNLKFLSSLRKSKYIKELRLDFVVQKLNYTEMPEFVEIAKRLEVDGAYFSLVSNWGHWSEEEYFNHNVANESHPEFESFINILKNPIFNDPIVIMGNVAGFKKS